MTSPIQYTILNDGTIIYTTNGQTGSFNYIIKPSKLSSYTYEYTSEWYDTNTNELIGVIYYDSDNSANTLIYKKSHVIIVYLLYNIIANEEKLARYISFTNHNEYDKSNSIHYDLFNF